jgi:phage terminase large subunit-like protein
MSALDAVLADPSIQKEFAELHPIEQAVVNWQLNWLGKQAHAHQIEPAGDWWNIWLMLAGRGAGKTRASAETLAGWAWEQPNTRWLVSAPTSGDLKGTCFEGDSGLMSVIPPALIAKYNSSLHEIHLINGSFIKGIPASEPERFRGPQFHGGWLDELAAWEYLRESWDMIMFGIRLGTRTKLICSTTPKPKEVVMELIDREGDDVVITRASTYSNMKNLAPSFQKQILQYEGTNLGRQEIHAEIIDPEEGGIVRRDWFKLWPNGKTFPKFEFIIQSYDCGYKDGAANDPTGCITLGAFKPLDGGMCVMVIDCWQEKLQYPDLRPKIIDEFESVYGEGKEKKRVDLLLVEDKAAGISLIQDLQRAHLPVIGYNPGRADKTQRLSIVANIIRAGRVWVPESSQRRGFVRDWAEGMVSQICSFPEGTVHDEFVDCISQGLRYMRDAGWISIDAPPRDDYDEDDIYDADEYNQRSRAKVNPYAV